MAFRSKSDHVINVTAAGPVSVQGERGSAFFNVQPDGPVSGYRLEGSYQGKHLFAEDLAHAKDSVRRVDYELNEAARKREQTARRNSDEGAWEAVDANTLTKVTIRRRHATDLSQVLIVTAQGAKRTVEGHTLLRPLTEAEHAELAELQDKVQVAESRARVAELAGVGPDIRRTLDAVTVDATLDEDGYTVEFRGRTLTGESLLGLRSKIDAAILADQYPWAIAHRDDVFSEYAVVETEPALAGGRQPRRLFTHEEHAHAALLASEAEGVARKAWYGRQQQLRFNIDDLP